MVARAAQWLAIAAQDYMRSDAEVQTDFRRKLP
jgi:hypothetical protein